MVKKILISVILGPIVAASFYYFQINYSFSSQFPFVTQKIIAPYFSPEVFLTPTSQPYISPIPTIPLAPKEIKLPIIMYHYVEHVQDQNDLVKKRLNINPNVFEAEVQELVNDGYTFYFVKDIPSILKGETTISDKSVVLTFDDGYEDFYSVVFPILKKYNVKGTVFVINHFLNRHGFLSTEELYELSHSDLVEIGAHTLDHAYLKQASPEYQIRQITESKAQLEEIIGKPVETFAYPYGDFSANTLDFVKEASYSAAVSVISGRTQSLQNMYYLYRIRAGSLVLGKIDSILQNWKN